MKRLLLIIAILLLFPSFAFGEVITTCGASKGYGYYFEGGIVPKDKSGWSEDSISKGHIILVLEGDGKEFNIYYKDAEMTKSAKEDGGKVLLAHLDENFQTIMILVIYPGQGVVEHYLFRLDGSGNGGVVWGNDKGTNLMAKGTLFKATCSKRNQ